MFQVMTGSNTSNNKVINTKMKGGSVSERYGSILFILSKWMNNRLNIS